MIFEVEEVNVRELDLTATLQSWHPRTSEFHLASANGRFFRERQERRGEVFTLKDRFHVNISGNS